MKSTHLFVTLIAIISICISVCHCCTCTAQTAEQQFCKADYFAVVVVGARHIERNNSNIVYNITPKTVLRVSTSVAANTTNLYILTLGDCSLSLENGKEYAIAAYSDGGRPTVSQCSYHVLWSDIKPEEKAGIMGGYKC